MKRILYALLLISFFPLTAMEQDPNDGQKRPGQGEEGANKRQKTKEFPKLTELCQQVLMKSDDDQAAIERVLQLSIPTEVACKTIKALSNKVCNTYKAQLEELFNQQYVSLKNGRMIKLQDLKEDDEIITNPFHVDASIRYALIRKVDSLRTIENILAVAKDGPLDDDMGNFLAKMIHHSFAETVCLRSPFLGQLLPINQQHIARKLLTSMQGVLPQSAELLFDAVSADQVQQATQLLQEVSELSDVPDALFIINPLTGQSIATDTEQAKKDLAIRKRDSKNIETYSIFLSLQRSGGQSILSIHVLTEHRQLLPVLIVNIPAEFICKKIIMRGLQGYMACMTPEGERIFTFQVPQWFVDLTDLRAIISYACRQLFSSKGQIFEQPPRINPFINVIAFLFRDSLSHNNLLAFITEATTVLQTKALENMVTELQRIGITDQNFKDEESFFRLQSACDFLLYSVDEYMQNCSDDFKRVWCSQLKEILTVAKTILFPSLYLSFHAVPQ